MQRRRTEWWAPIWPGLVVDPAGKHIRRLGPAVWLLLYLIAHARRQTGLVIHRRATIARKMHVPLRTVQRWLLRLARYEYVDILRDGAVPVIRVKRWRSLPTRQN